MGKGKKDKKKEQDEISADDLGISTTYSAETPATKGAIVTQPPVEEEVEENVDSPPKIDSKPLVLSK